MIGRKIEVVLFCARAERPKPRRTVASANMFADKSDITVVLIIL